MGLFDFFKKRKDDLGYDPTNIKLLDLQPGFMFDYREKTWVVQSVYEYGWGNNYFSFEFVIDAGDEQSVMSVEERSGGLFVTIEKSVKPRAIDADLPEYILKNEVPPRQLTYEGVTYLYDRESIGSSRPEGTDEWSDLISWEYYDHSDTKVLCVEQWGENDFEAYVGTVVPESEFTSILPGNLP